MSVLSKSLCWAASFLGLALANRSGLVTDGNAGVMFAVLTALWVATSSPRRCGTSPSAG